MKLKNVFSLITLALTLAVFTTSCNIGSHPGFKKSKSGVYYKIHNDNNDTTSVREGMIVTMDLKYGLKDSVMFDSKQSPKPIILQVAKSEYAGDFNECITLLNQGDSATFILKAGPLFKTTFRQPELPEPLTDDSEIIFDVTIQKVQTQEQMEMETKLKNMELEKQEVIKLQEYVQKNNITATPSGTGIYYIETEKGKGKSPAEETYLTAHYTVYLLGGEQLFSTRERGEPVDFKYKSQYENEGFHEVLGMMREGGKAKAIIPSAMAFGEQGAGNIVPPFSTLYYEIELIKVISKDEFNARQQQKEAKKKAESEMKVKEEESNIQKYLTDNRLTATTTLPSGLIYIETKAGNGPKPEAGKKVKVHYTGKLLNGSKFDSSLDRGEPFEFVIGQRQVIEGWDQGIALMSEGAKGLLVIPYRLGYKERGAGEDIPPYSTLVFEVELVEIEK
ncbi:MAG: FKBP-type peptidyl-prolyl cis-trans isomerase [Bacteroidales bacterium]|jgi:peptidylprolyl isomerase|nr:FKBP-type peptidyl-prolyl cis-trans isomerase [Bacteroidales bacterium]